MIPFPEVFAWSVADDPRFVTVGLFGSDDDGVLWRPDNGDVFPNEAKSELPFDGSQLIQPHAARRLVNVDTRGRV